MSIRAKIASSAVSAGVLLIGWQAGAHNAATAADPATGSVTAAPSGGSGADGSAQPTPASSSSSRASSSGGYVDGTYTGMTESNRFGSWTVTVTIANGKITDVSSATTANDSRSRAINQQAEPMLRTAVLAAQSADVQTFSGATLTCNSYRGSLQSALDQASG